MLSHWLTEAGLSTDDAAPALEGDTRADVCIIGGGFCGLWTAIRLKQRDPSIDIAIVEQGLCGSGASGRNGGFVLSWWAKFGSLCKFCPSDEAARLARASADAVGEIGRFCAEHGIEHRLTKLNHPRASGRGIPDRVPRPRVGRLHDRSELHLSAEIGVRRRSSGGGDRRDQRCPTDIQEGKEGGLFNTDPCRARYGGYESLTGTGPAITTTYPNIGLRYFRRRLAGSNDGSGSHW